MTVKFGLALDFAHPTRPLNEQLDRYVELLRIGERYGFDSVTAGEGYAVAPGYGHVSSPLLVLATLASRTTLRLGTSVTLLPAWNPLRLAYDAAVLDQISNGRLILGMGVGGASVHRRFGREEERLGDWVDDALAALRALWSGADGYKGKALSVVGGVGVKPVQPGGPTVWVGGALRRSAERAAEWGDGWCASTNYSFSQIARQSERYRAALRARGKDLAGAVVSINRLAVLAEDEAQAREVATTYAGRVLQRYARAGSFGNDPALAERGPAALFAEYDADWCLVGTPAQVVERVRRYAGVGVTQIQVRVSPDEIPLEAAARTVELLGRDVIPQLR
jgi:alkanesulfonate monooxygenase SsuD/methylene tetrahydromethanopterin reductase-like flavin-dependent oxidoreductase (luciferase family)